MINFFSQQGPSRSISFRFFHMNSLSLSRFDHSYIYNDTEISILESKTALELYPYKK